MKKLLIILLLLFFFSIVFAGDRPCGWFCPPDGWSNYSDKIHATGCMAQEYWKCADGGSSVIVNPGPCINGTSTTTVQNCVDCSYTCPCPTGGVCGDVCCDGWGPPCGPPGRFVPNTCCNSVTTSVSCGVLSLQWKDENFSIIPNNTSIKVQAGSKYKFSVTDYNAGFMDGKKFNFTLFAVKPNGARQNIISGLASVYSVAGKTEKFADYNWTITATEFTALSNAFSSGYNKLLFNAYYSSDVNLDSGLVSFSIYSCIGSQPLNSVLCEGDDAITENASSVLVQDCSTPPGSVPKCEFICAPGYTYSAGACVANTFQCTGGIPTSSSLCSGAADGLTQNTAISLVNSCSGAKCEYECSMGYSLQGGVCVKNTFQCVGSTPTFSILCDLDDNALVNDTYKILVESCSAPIGSDPKCEFVCQNGFAREMILGQWVCKIVEVCNAADDDSDGNIDNGFECIKGQVNSSRCPQSASVCDNNKTGVRDLFGDCSNSCSCNFDEINYSCKKNSCGAQCSNDSDCASGYYCSNQCYCKQTLACPTIVVEKIGQDGNDTIADVNLSITCNSSTSQIFNADLNIYDSENSSLIKSIHFDCNATPHTVSVSGLASEKMYSTLIRISNVPACVGRGFESYFSVSKSFNASTIPDSNILFAVLICIVAVGLIISTRKNRAF